MWAAGPPKAVKPNFRNKPISSRVGFDLNVGHRR
jgi:hypothetical protein